jgi:hypothetical protein
LRPGHPAVYPFGSSVSWRVCPSPHFILGERSSPCRTLRIPPNRQPSSRWRYSSARCRSNRTLCPRISKIRPSIRSAGINSPLALRCIRVAKQTSRYSSHRDVREPFLQFPFHHTVSHSSGTDQANSPWPRPLVQK